MAEAIFRGTQPTSTTAYYPVPTGPTGQLVIHVGWKDATSNATITLQTSLFPSSDAPGEVVGDAWEWFNESVTIAGPTAAAASCSMTHIGNIGGEVRARLRVVTTAASNLEIWTESA